MTCDTKDSVIADDDPARTILTGRATPSGASIDVSLDILRQLRQEQAERAQLHRSDHCDTAKSSSRPAPEPVQRAMEILYAGLTRLAEGFSRLNPEVRVSYQVDEAGTLCDLQQDGYAVHTEDPVLPRFVFGFSCDGAHCLRHIVAKAGEREQFRERLEELGLRFSIDDIGTWRYGFSIAPYVPVRFEFSPDLDGKAIRLTIHNLSQLGTQRFSIQAGQVNDEMVNELGKMVLRRENRFAQLCGCWVSEQIREQLRQRVASRKREREKIARELREDDQHHERGLRSLLFGHAETLQHGRHLPHHVVTLHGDGADEGWVDWDGDLDTTLIGRTAPAKVEPENLQLLIEGEHDESVQEPPAHAWIITADMACSDSAASLGKRGPAGSNRLIPTPRIVSDGEHFQLKGRSGEVRFSGMIAGDYQGLEPLVEFGLEHGCVAIEYDREGRWVRVRAQD